MAKVQTSELTDAALDWAAWTAAGGAAAYPKTASGAAFLKLWKGNSAKYIHPSTDWAQGGPIIERERIAIDYDHDVWNAASYGLSWYIGGPTPLDRCHALLRTQQTRPGGRSTGGIDMKTDWLLVIFICAAFIYLLWSAT